MKKRMFIICLAMSLWGASLSALSMPWGISAASARIAKASVNAAHSASYLRQGLNFAGRAVKTTASTGLNLAGRAVKVTALTAGRAVIKHPYLSAAVLATTLAYNYNKRFRIIVEGIGLRTSCATLDIADDCRNWIGQQANAGIIARSLAKLGCFLSATTSLVATKLLIFWMNRLFAEFPQERAQLIDSIPIDMRERLATAGLCPRHPDHVRIELMRQAQARRQEQREIQERQDREQQEFIRQVQRESQERQDREQQELMRQARQEREYQDHEHQELMRQARLEREYQELRHARLVREQQELARLEREYQELARLLGELMHPAQARQASTSSPTTPIRRPLPSTIPASEECAVCFRQAQEINQDLLSVTQCCGQFLCQNCALRVRNEQDRCPYCRVSPLQTIAATMQPPEGEEPATQAPRING